MAAKYLLKNSKNGKFTFSLLAGNGQIVMTASEIYDSKTAALNGIESCKKNGTEDARFDRKKSSADEPYFVLKAGNGQIIGKSEMYSSVASMENGIASVKTNAGTAVEDGTE